MEVSLQCIFCLNELKLSIHWLVQSYSLILLLNFSSCLSFYCQFLVFIDQFTLLLIFFTFLLFYYLFFSFQFFIYLYFQLIYFFPGMAYSLHDFPKVQLRFTGNGALLSQFTVCSALRPSTVSTALVTSCRTGGKFLYFFEFLSLCV